MKTITFEQGLKNASIKSSLKQPIADILQKYNVVFHEFWNNYDKNVNDTGFFVSNGTINICSNPDTILALQHELAHLVLIKNHNRLLIKNWGMPLATRREITPKFKLKSFYSECKVWGIEQYISDKPRIVNERWTEMAAKANGLDKVEVYSNGVINRDQYCAKMNDEIILQELESKLAFVQSHIDKHTNFSSTKFDWFE